MVNKEQLAAAEAMKAKISDFIELAKVAKKLKVSENIEVTYGQVDVMRLEIKDLAKEI